MESERNYIYIYIFFGLSFNLETMAIIEGNTIQTLSHFINRNVTHNQMIDKISMMNISSVANDIGPMFYFINTCRFRLMSKKVQISRSTKSR